MNVLVSTWLLVMTSSVVVLGASLKAGPMTPFGGAVLERHSRSLGMPCLSLSYLTDLKTRFSRFLDINDDGKSTPEEVKEYLRKFRDNVKDETVSAFIGRRDMNDNGVIDFVPDYVQSVAGHDNTIEGAREWFHLQDANDDGFISIPELMRVAQALGMSPEEGDSAVRGYYLMVDSDHDNKLAFDEFKQLYVM